MKISTSRVGSKVSIKFDQNAVTVDVRFLAKNWNIRNITSHIWVHTKLLSMTLCVCVCVCVCP